MARTRRSFSPEYKGEAVRLVLEQGLSVREAAQDLGLGKSTLERWIQAERDPDKDSNALTEPDVDELKRLRKENRVLRMERDILKKATALFAKTTINGSN